MNFLGRPNILDAISAGAARIGVLAALATGSTFVAPDAALAAGTVTTQLCIYTTAKHGGSDGTNISAILTGVNTPGSTGKLDLNTSANDFVKNQWGCFEWQPSELASKADVGFHTGLEIGFLDGGDKDDFCIGGLSSHRWENWNTQTRNGKLLSTTHFIEKGTAEYCLGNYDRNSKDIRIFASLYAQPTAAVAAVEMKWKEIGQQFGTGELLFSTTWGADRTDEKTKTSHWELGVTQTVKVSGKVAGTGVESETSVSVSGGEAYGLNQAVTLSESQSTSTKCIISGPAENVWLYQWEYDVKHSDGTSTVKIPVKAFACVRNNPEPGQFRPVCLPGCCQNESCTTCRSAAGCNVIVNPKWQVSAVAAITVSSATYGANCGTAPGNVTGDIAAQCNGKASCDYSVDYQRLGDPAPNCAKDYAVDYSCNGVAKRATAAAEAGFGSVVSLICGP